MAKVEVYSTPFCPYCVRARHYLDRESIEYTNIDVSGQPELRREMFERSNGGTTVPQIFINDQSIGGCDEMFQLIRAGELDELLQQ